MDVAAVFQHLLELPAFRDRAEKAAGGRLSRRTLARLGAIVFLHDIGKLHPGFQAKGWPEGLWDRPVQGHVTESWALLDRAYADPQHPFHKLTTVVSHCPQRWLCASRGRSVCPWRHSCGCRTATTSRKRVERRERPTLHGTRGTLRLSPCEAEIRSMSHGEPQFSHPLMPRTLIDFHFSGRGLHPDGALSLGERKGDTQ